MIFQKKVIGLLSVPLVVSALTLAYPTTVYAHCKVYHPHHCIPDIYKAGKIIYEDGKEAYKVGKPYYRQGKLIARPVYDLYTGNYIGFIDSAGKLIKEF